jgi:DNA polymerase-3 subunit beta
MKIICLKKDIDKAVEIASRVVSNNATLPVLRCLVFEATDKDVLVRATNLELSVETLFSAEVKKKGIVAVPASVLLSVLKTSSSNTKVSLEADENNCVLTIGGGKNTIKTISSEDFPTIPKPETKKKHIIPSNVLVQGFRNVLYSASASLIKPELASVYVYHEDGKMLFVATDSFRLAEKKVPYRTDEDIPAVIIPAKNAVELTRILEMKEEGDLEVFIDESQYSIQKNGLYVTSRIIDGSFPDYHSIMPKGATTEAVILKEDFSNSLKKGQIFSDKFGQVSLHVYPSKKSLTFSARNSDVGEVFDSVDAALKGEDLDISFNNRYLLDALQSIPGDSVSLSFAGVGKPLIIRGIGDDSFTYLVMPMNR